MAIRTNAAPNLYGSTSVSVVFHNDALGVSFSGCSPHPHTSVTCGYTLLKIQNSIGATAKPSDSTQLKSECTVLSCKNLSTYWTSASEIFLVGSVWSLILPDVKLQRSSSFIASSRSHLLDVAVLASGCTACTALVRASNMNISTLSSTLGLEAISYLRKDAAATFH